MSHTRSWNFGSRTCIEPGEMPSWSSAFPGSETPFLETPGTAELQLGIRVSRAWVVGGRAAKLSRVDSGSDLEAVNGSS